MDLKAQTETTEALTGLGNPSPKQQSWGALISIIIIVVMIVIGAFYAWGKRITEQNIIVPETLTSPAK